MRSSLQTATFPRAARLSRPILLCAAFTSAVAVELPFDRTCPMFYDNDDPRNVYTDEYLMALAHLGEINLAGIITTYAPNARV